MSTFGNFTFDLCYICNILNYFILIILVERKFSLLDENHNTA